MGSGGWQWVLGGGGGVGRDGGRGSSEGGVGRGGLGVGGKPWMAEEPGCALGNFWVAEENLIELFGCKEKPV